MVALFRTAPRSFMPLALWALAACSAPDPLAPVSQEPAKPPVQVKGYSFLVTLDLVNGTVTVERPTPGPQRHSDGPATSLLGPDVLGVTTTNFTRSAIGAAVAGKRTVGFDLALTNKLSTADLVTPTFPDLPHGSQGILAFPYTVAAFGVQGGKALADTSWNGDGTAGSGAPINFFNDLDTCSTAANSDCYRWILFGAPLAPATTTSARHVSFTVDKNVTTVSVNMVVAADLADHPVPPPQPGQGAVTGRVLLEGNAAVGATVTLTPGNYTTTVDALGKYLFTGLPVDEYTVQVTALANGCTAAGQPVSVTSGGVTTSNFNVSCPHAIGVIAGTAMSPQFGALGGRLVELEQESGETVNSELTDASGRFVFPRVLPGNYVVTIQGLSSLCHDADEFQSVTVVAGDTAHSTLTVDCPGATPSATISGLVTRPDGEPLDGITITVEIDHDKFTATSNGAGAYHFDADILPSGTGSVAALIGATDGFPSNCSAPAPEQITIPRSSALDHPITIPCGPPASASLITGTVSSPTLGNLPGVTVGLAIGDFAFFKAITGTDGTFAFPGFTWTNGPTSVGLVVQSELPAACDFPGSPSGTLQAGQPLHFDVLVDCSGTGGDTVLTGIVSSQSGPLGRVVYNTQTGHGLISGTTNDAGRYALLRASIFPDLTESVVVSLPGQFLPAGCAEPSPVTVTVHAGQVADQPIVVTCAAQAVGSIVGTVSGFGDGTPLIPVVAQATSGGNPVVSQLGAGGAFTIQLPSGQFVVSVPTLPAACTGAEPRSVLVASGSTPALTFDVHCPPSIFGRLHTSTGLSLDGFTIETNSPLAPAMTTQTHWGGYFSFDGSSLPAGQVSFPVIQDGLPQGCAPAPEHGTIWGLPTNPDPSGSIQVDIVVDCTGANATSSLRR